MHRYGSPTSRRHRRVSALAGTLLLGLAACGSTGSGDTAGGQAEASGQGTPLAGAPSWCGTKKITLALADGFGGNNWRQVTAAEARDEASKCPSVTDFSYADGQGNTQKAISDVQGFVAKGVDALVVFPDAGQAMLPALRSAHDAGVVTVPYRVDPGGRPGKDYDAFISTDFSKAGELWAQFLVKALPDGGTVLNLGGPAANSQSQAEYEGMQRVLKDHPDITFVGQTPYAVTNWDPAQTQRVVTAALATNPKIDAVTTDFGSALASAFGAFDQAGRPIPTIATEDSNQLACDYRDRKEAGKGFELFTVDSQNAMGRLAVQYAVAKASGGVLPDTTEFPQTAFEDSLSGQPHPVQCDDQLPPDAFVSSTLTPEQQIAALK
ncbi:substrate-binding domain-containing protein [Kineococcus rhizosphaerae]|uniref:Ribose transport system substrate-binding protein n=1 Tax=Kineococcus rhizosphaerae TaxID=559628 RepID=A0A2T0QXK7_9ACTN|nr:substrate-binding domain-containing protein [Kineococcus rhizosphaerae]PRY10521.1 ribose transport system substrate-binding protein [Kineococcus rhizosphaerae]